MSPPARLGLGIDELHMPTRIQCRLVQMTRQRITDRAIHVDNPRPPYRICALAFRITSNLEPDNQDLLNLYQILPLQSKEN